MSREELLKTYVELIGSDANEKGFWKEVAFYTKKELISRIVELANYYKHDMI